MVSENATTRRHVHWRWAVPALIVTAVVVVVGLRPVLADASPALPPRTAAQLLADLPAAAGHPFTGTVETTARLGLPDLPASVQGQHAPLSATALLSGTHTLRVWYAGPDRQRVVLVGDLAEMNLVRRGQDLWAWNSDTRTGAHLRLPDDPPTPPLGSPMPHELLRGLTPQHLAAQLLMAVEPTTKVTVDGTASVAGRDVYEIVVAPRDDRSLVQQIRLAIDARTSLPLRLQVFATGSSSPALESTFTSISYETPSDDVFREPGGALKQLTVPGHTRPTPGAPERSRPPRVHGSGWTSVLELPQALDLSARADGHRPAPGTHRNGDTDGSRPAGPPAGGRTPQPGSSGHPSSDDGDPGAAADLVQMLQRAGTPVSGDYGSGRVLRTALFSVLVLEDGRVFVGAVTPATLEQVATTSRRP